MILVFRLILSALLVLSANPFFAQGCSDAGVCSVGGMQPGMDSTAIPNSLFTWSHGFGLSEAKGNLIYIQTIQADAQIVLWPTSVLGVNVPYQYSVGDLGRIGALGDVTISLSQQLSIKGEGRLMITGGMRIPSNDSDLELGGLPLPMEYQSSLGSYDLIFGMAYAMKKWRFAIGYQHPLNRNSNGFLHEVYTEESIAQYHFESNRLLRGDDLMLRIERRFDFKKHQLFIGLLPLYRLQEDEIILQGQKVRLANSMAPTVNLTISDQIRLSNRFDLKINYGNPLLWRKTRADGLTRIVVLSVGLQIRW